MSILKVALKDILPNPYRNEKVFVLNADKIDALLRSFTNSDFWDGSIQARPSKTHTDKYEIAFGHHRVEAARLHGYEAIGIVVSELTNEKMLHMMADENANEYQHDARVTIETLRAVIEAYGRGEIELEAPAEGHGQQKYSLPGGKLYTLATVARWLNWVKPSDRQATNACRNAFDAYQTEATTKAALDKLDDVSDVAVQAVNTVVRAARRQKVS